MVRAFLVLSIPVFLWVLARVFLRLGYKVKNFEGEQTPFSLGVSAFIILIIFVPLLKFESTALPLFYLSVIWITGFIDDCFGTKYPKGLKGHIKWFVQTGKFSTGLVKLVGTVTAAFIFAFFFKQQLIEIILTFSILILSPHVMNLFDTRPLRVWKVMFFHSLLLFPTLLQLSLKLRLEISFIIATFVYFEAKRLSMLGDNGATLLGGVMGLMIIFHLPNLIQMLLLCVYMALIIITEKISLSELIEKRPLLRWFDRWGVS